MSMKKPSNTIAGLFNMLYILVAKWANN